MEGVWDGFWDGGIGVGEVEDGGWVYGIGVEGGGWRGIGVSIFKNMLPRRNNAPSHHSLDQTCRIYTFTINVLLPQHLIKISA